MFRRDTPAEAEFRMEVRTWLEANLPVALRGRTTRPPPAELMPWYHTLSRKGWIAPHWPKQYGGMGATLNEQIIMTEELARIGAPHLPVQGLNHIGPILMEFGDRRAEGAASAAHHRGHGDLGAGLFRAGRGLRPCQPFDPRNAGGRSFRGAGTEDLDHLGPSFGLDVRAGAHRSAGPAAASRHQLPADRSAQPGHQDQADQDDRGRRRVQRGVLRRCHRAGRKPGRKTA